MKVIATEKAPAAIGPYSQAYVITEFFYTSDSLELILRQEILAEIQSKSRLSGLGKNVGEILKAAGTDYEHVLKNNMFPG